MRRSLSIGLALAALVALAGCGSLGGGETDRPVGVGRNADELKRSPCACQEMQQDFGPGWREDLRQRVGRNDGGGGALAAGVWADGVWA